MDEGKRESMELEVMGLVEASIGKVVERRNSILSRRLARSSLASSASEIKEKEERNFFKKSRERLGDKYANQVLCFDCF